MTGYILLTEIRTKAEGAEWWMEQTSGEESVKILIPLKLQKPMTCAEGRS